MRRLFVVLFAFILAAFIVFWIVFYRSFQMPIEDPSQNGIYLYTKIGCPYCYKAQEYITEQYPNLNIEIKIVRTQQDLKLMFACADRVHINRMKLGTPLICMPKHYILGWDAKNQQLFDEYVAEYLETK